MSVDMAKGLAISVRPVVDASHGKHSPLWEGRRSAEFDAGRHAARQALDRLGTSTDEPLTALADGGVLWPKGSKGSISHCCHLAVAAVSRLGPSIGIDVEKVQPFSQAMLELMSSAQEVRAMDALRNFSHDTRACLFFSAKEAAFKAMSHSGVARSIRQIEIRCEPLGPEHGAFHAEVPGGFHGIGYYASVHDVVLTLCQFLPKSTHTPTSRMVEGSPHSRPNP